MWTDRQIIAALNRASELVERLTWLLRSVSRTDASDRPTPYAAAATALGHVALGMWAARGAVEAGAPVWAAIPASAALWGMWEALQYRAAPGTRTRRDALLADLPSNLLGAATIAGSGFAWWAASTLEIATWLGIMAVAFGRVPEK